MAGLIVAGWDPHNGGSVWSINLGGSLVRQPFSIGGSSRAVELCICLISLFFATGSGSSYIYGYCDTQYKPNMTRKEAELFVVNGKRRCFALSLCVYIAGVVHRKRLLT